MQQLAAAEEMAEVATAMAAATATVMAMADGDDEV